MDQKQITEDNVSLSDILESMPEVTKKAEETEEISEDTVSEENTENAADNDGNTASMSEDAEEAVLYPDNASEDEEMEEDAIREDAETEEDAPRKEKKKRRKKRGHGRLVFGLLLSVFIISASILSAAFILKAAKEMLAIGRSDIKIVVEVPLGASTADIAEQLYNEGIIGSTELFRLYSKFRHADSGYIAGTHSLSPNMDYKAIIETLQEEIEVRRETADVVFPEGITLIDAAKRLEDKNVCKADEFIKAFNASSFGFDFEAKVKANALKFYRMEGYFFPDTYQFYVEEDPRIVAKKICKNFEARVTPDLYGRMNDLGMELEEVLTLASIVQAEASNTRDMKKVASVFYNRLNNPDEYPLLQSDPTTNYVEDVIMPNIDIKSEKVFEAYDTYRGAGLPPGPICNPGLDAINAVLYPAETDYYYFCSNLETGEFFFAETLSQHEQNLIEAGLV